MAFSLNRAQIIGNVTRDPEVRQTPSGQTVANFGVATNRSWTDQSGQKQEKAEFHNVVVWGKLAEICGQYVKKGRKVYVEGRLQTRDWEGQDGVKRQRTEIVAENFIILDRPPAGDFSSGMQRTQRGIEPTLQPTQEETEVPLDKKPDKAAVSNNDEPPLDDLPF